MTTNQPTLEERLSRLETLFTNMGETVLPQHEAIAAMTVSIQRTTQNVDSCTHSIQETTQRVDEQSATIDATYLLEYKQMDEDTALLISFVPSAQKIPVLIIFLSFHLLRV
ncbi:MAG: hypothetical protein SAK29_27100 [Scytonema sp. PMC 1069.18]|nr:hypothetical protein [Scytonema sp. PMC 1069.18]MEC4885800.1 hypothetical protein [Scytonema sp. PMC 1070.18]